MTRLPSSLRGLPADLVLLFATRFTRLFAYGALSVVLVFYLVSLGLSEIQVGMLLTLTLAGDIAMSLWLTTRGDRIGRRRMLVAGALLMAGAGLTFALAGSAFGWFRNTEQRVGTAVAIAATTPLLLFAVWYAVSAGFRSR